MTNRADKPIRDAVKVMMWDCLRLNEKIEDYTDAQLDNALRNIREQLNAIETMWECKPAHRPTEAVAPASTFGLPQPTEYITGISVEDTSGGVINDIVHTDTGHVVVISEGGIGIYETYDHYNEGDEIEYIQRD